MKINGTIGSRWYWIIAASLFFVMMINCGVGYYSVSLLVKPVTDTFLISSGDFAVLYLFYGVGSAAAAALLHSLVRRFSLKALIVLGGGISAVGYCIFAWANDFSSMFVGGILIGASTVFAGTATVQMMIARWFYTRRSQVTGLIAAASGVGTAVGGPVIGRIIGTEGWRSACVIIGALVMVLVCAQTVLLLKETPESVQLLPYGAKNTAGCDADALTKSDAESGYTLCEGAKKPFFFMFAAGMVIVAIVYQVISLYQSTMLIERGFSESTAAMCLSVFATADMICKASAGLVAEKRGFRVVTLYCSAATAAAFVVIRMANGMVGAVLFSLLLGFWPTMCVLYGVTVSISLFGKKYLSEFIGFTQTLMCCCSLVGMPVVRRLYNAAGSFSPIINIAVGLMVVFALMMWTMLSPRNLYHEKGGGKV